MLKMTIDTSKEAVERVLDGVTDAPWTDSPREIADADDYSVDRQEDGDNGLCYSSVGVKGGQTVAIVVVPMSFGMDSEQAANSRFIAAARELVPALSSDLEAMRDRAEQAEAREQNLMVLLDATATLREQAEARVAELGGVIERYRLIIADEAMDALAEPTNISQESKP